MLSLSETLLYSTVRIEGTKTNGETSVGTGFFFQQDERLFVVTNKHVVDGVQNGHFFMHALDKKDDEQPNNQKLLVNFTGSQFIGHPNPGVDIAIINVSSAIIDLHNQGFFPFYSQAVKETIPTEDVIHKHISSVEEIVFIGYPDGIWDSVNNLPIIRKGITATPFNIDFMGQPLFLIDASVFPGSSGSPVFAYSNGAYTDRDGNVLYGNKLYLLGVIARVYQRLEEGDIVVKDIPTSQVHVAKVKQMIDLGIVFKSNTILETINYYLHNSQLQQQS